MFGVRCSMFCFFQMLFDLLQPIPVSSGRRVRRELQQPADLFEGATVPDLQDDDFALFRRQLGQATHRRAFRRVFVR